MGRGNVNIETFRNVDLGEDYIILKRGFELKAIGKAKKYFSAKKWHNIQKLADDIQYSYSDSEHELFHDCGSQDLDYIEVENSILNITIPLNIFY